MNLNHYISDTFTNIFISFTWQQALKTIILTISIAISGFNPMPKEQTVSIIIPLYNEEPVIAMLFERLETVSKTINEQVQIVFVNDGSHDNTWTLIEQHKPEHFKSKLINLSRNFGKEAAVTAGLHEADGDAVVLIDADLQDPPELIPEMIEAWHQGADIVNMKRKTREGESWFKKLSAKYYYRILNRLADCDIPENVGDFRLISRRVVEHINNMPERNRYMKGIMSWPGFNNIIMEFDRAPRQAGTTKWNYFQLLKLALSGITSFSITPLRLVFTVGFFVAAGSLFYGIFILIRTLLFGDPVSGFPTIIITQLFIAGVQLISIGVVGEYVGRIYIEVKSRPTYLIKDIVEKKKSPKRKPREKA